MYVNINIYIFSHKYIEIHHNSLICIHFVKGGLQMDTYSLLRSVLNVSSQRAELTSSNIANINTPNYKAKRVEFESYLKNALNGETLSLNTTHVNHLNTNNLQTKVITSRDTSLKENGNNVDLEVEMLNQSTNSLYYSALTAQLNGRYQMLNYVLSNN